MDGLAWATPWAEQRSTESVIVAGPMLRLRSLIASSWTLSRLLHGLRGRRLEGSAQEQVWYFAYGANMHDSAFQSRRKMRPLEWRAGRVFGYRLRFNLDGRPHGKSAPANLEPGPGSEVWGVLYRLTRQQLLQLDATEGSHYRHVELDGEDRDGGPLRAIAYIATGHATDGRPSLRYITLLREGARAHGLPDHWLRFLDQIRHAE